MTYADVHELLARRNWSAGVQAPSLAVVGHWFNGRRRPRSMEHLRGLLDVLDLSLDEAIRGAPMEAVTAAENAMLQRMRAMSDEDVVLLLAMAEKLGRQ